MDASKCFISSILFINSYPTVPSNFNESNLSASVANSIGNIVKTSLQKPLINKLTAFSTLMPR